MTGGETLARDLARARRLEWWTLAAMAGVLAVMTAASGGSAAFRTALVEDWLSLVPAIVFLIALRYERRPPTRRFAFGFHRVHSLAFLIAAVALAGVGGLLLIESVITLVRAERPTVAPVRLLGRDIWGGWVMIAALVLSVLPPMILGRLKQPVARRLHDKVLHTDALMQKADWMTGLAGIVGIVGIAWGLWWLDAAAAIFIALDVVRDGLRSLRIAGAELVDGMPREVDGDAPARDALAVEAWLQRRFPDARIQLRETGRYIRAVVVGADRPDGFDVADAVIPGLDDRWRLDGVAFAPTLSPSVRPRPRPDRAA